MARLSSNLHVFHRKSGSGSSDANDGFWYMAFRHRLSRSFQATQLPTPAPRQATGPSRKLVEYLPAEVVDAINGAGDMRDLYAWQV